MYSTKTTALGALVSLIGFASAAGGQDMSNAVRLPDVPAGIQMDANLWRFSQEVTLEGREPQAAADSYGYRRRPNGRINVEIVGPRGAQALELGDLLPLDLEVDATWRRRSSVWIRPELLPALAERLPQGFELKQVLPLDLDDAEDDFSESTNASTYKSSGADGSGIRIAIIDSGFERLAEAQAAGQAPTGAKLTTKTYSGDLGDGSKHGTACLETVFDHAPGATYFIYETNNLTHMGKAVDDAIANDVDVYSHSMSRYNEGWYDDEGDACAAADDAVSSGAVFFTSAGNRAGSHWKGKFSDGDGDDWHQFSGADETIDLTLGDGSGGNFYLAWNTSSSTTDYDFYLYDSSFSVVKSSTSIINNKFEDFYFENDTGSTETFHISVWKRGGGNVDFEIFFHGADFDEHQVEESSATSPSNSTDSRVVSCGAVKWDKWDLPSGTAAGAASNFPQGYSSRGPSNSGMTLPDISSATGNQTIAYGSGATGTSAFGGTSCATPNAAGIAASFWSEFPDLASTAVAHCLFRQAAAYRDWGDAGKDDIFGEGGIYLHPYAPDTALLSPDYTDWVSFLDLFGGWSGTTMQGPFLRVSDAVTYVPTGGRLLLLSGEFPEMVTVTKAVDIVSVPEDSRIGN